MNLSSTPARPQPSGLESALSLAIAVERSHAAVLLVYDESTGLLHPIAGVGLTPEQLKVIGPQDAGVGAFGEAFTGGVAVTIGDVQRSGPPVLTDLGRALRFRGIHIVPVSDVHAGRLGSLGVMHRRPRLPSGRETRLVALCAALVAEALAPRRPAGEPPRWTDPTSREGGKLLASISHELRTPLQAIAGYLELLRGQLEGSITPAQQEYLDRLRTSQRILSRTVGDILALSRAEAGDALPLDDVPVDGALGEAELIMSPLFHERGLALTIERAGAGVRVRADPGRLRQILINLLSNALKFTPSSGAVRLDCDADAAWVRLRVVDGGPGIAVDDRERIFAPFVQLKTPVFGDRSGIGLGLALSREYALAMNGDLVASTASEGGAAFILSLRRAGG
jgi:signal transduction histidine kinase